MSNDRIEASPKGAYTRQRILDATAKVLSQKGLAATRLSDIAKEAEVQAPAIYYYFNSREDLIVEVIVFGSVSSHEIVTGVLAELPPTLSPLDRLIIAVEVHLRNALQISDYALASTRNIGQLPEKLMERPDAERRRYGRLWRDLIQDAVDAGQCHPEVNPTVSLLLVLGALNYTIEWLDPSRRSVDEVVEAAQLMIRNGIGRPDAKVTEPPMHIGDPQEWLAARDTQAPAIQA